MRALLDECLPRQLKRDLPGHEARTVPECGWAGVENDELRSRTTDEFEVLPTADRNLEYQQVVARLRSPGSQFVPPADEDMHE